MFEATVRDGVCRLARPNTRWLSTGHAGGEHRADAAYNCTVPEGWHRTDLDAYVAERLDAAGFDTDAATGPALLTGVHQRHARRARLGPVEAVVTAGVSNPAALPVHDRRRRDHGAGDDSVTTADDHHAGTVNVVVGTTRALAPGALPNLLTVAAEAKAATLLDRVGVPGTTTDAVVAACDPAGDPAQFSGSATAVGAAARACVRDALAASLASRYPDGDYGVDDPESGVVTDARATVSALAPDH
ncbi:adenosylcobinamide amidohydrolase [Haloplanus aerogenes]|uniref:Adenosylcobinamide amidohydrolase n=1 Tax=Haloplanus aerogenes TaxID=660522 RepID=A0A3G8R086_9EURY|nr:adenosylcobinamide amidohydrolase [Haloplanus aerogenes]AZH27139.1 adenosylcobinamide amidohydrolase [Haloplanus aerogenes]